MKFKYTFVYVTTSCLLFYANISIAVVSTVLKDVIHSNGIGNIDLFEPARSKIIINASTLESFRDNNNGQLIFAIDVNEAADGSEKSSTQGIAIDTAEVVFIISGDEYRFSDYNTRTKSMLARGNSTQRQLYSTLLGSSGSNRLTPNSNSELNNSSFDSTVSFIVPIDISQASSAYLNITLLETNKSLGDPEDFYDFSNGFEDVAIITNDDADYLNALAPGAAEAPLVLPDETILNADGGSVYYPSQTSYYIAAYEDLFPNRGDYDFNDLVVGYRIATALNSDGNVTAIYGEGYLIARGAGYNHDWRIHINLPNGVTGSGSSELYLPDQTIPSPDHTQTFNGSGDIDMVIFSNTRYLWQDDLYEVVNTQENQTLVKGHRFSFIYHLDTPISAASLSPPFDPYLYVYDTGYEIHLEGHSPVLGFSKNIENSKTNFTDDLNYPFALLLPDSWQIPIERIDIGLAYPLLIDFINSNKIQHLKWYNSPNSNHVKSTTPDHWKW